MKPDKHNILARIFIPQYDELALFLMSLAFILLFISSPELRSASQDLLFKKPDPRSYIALVFFVLGILFSLYHVFTTRQKTAWEKITMIFFAVVVNGFGGMAAGLYLLEGSEGIFMVFPVWNIVNGVLLLVLFRLNIIDEDNIVDDNVNALQVLIGSAVVGATFVVCTFIFNLYWAVTFSICVTYASNVNDVLQKQFLAPLESKEHHKDA